MHPKKIKTPTDMLVMKVMELYDIEHQVVKALGKLSKKVNDEELRAGFVSHLAETEEQITRLEKVFEILDAKPRKAKLEGIRGILSDREEILSSETEEGMQDALVATATRKVEHYEMAGYMAASELANLLGHTEIEELLRESLGEELAADKRLSEAAQKLSETMMQEETESGEEKAEMI